MGAGAAGCALACLLGRAGRDVLVAERYRTAGKDKLCGGVLVSEGQRLMAEVYGAGALGALGAAEIDAMRVLYRDREAMLSMRFRALPRARLDAFLLERALRVGVRVVERTSIAAIDEATRVATLHDLDSGDEVRLRYNTLVAADGANSAVRKLVTGRQPRTVVSFEAQAALPRDGSRIVQRVYPGVAGGCWAISQGTSAVVGCLFFPDASREPVGDMRRRVLDFAGELGVPCGPLRGAPVPTGDDVLLRSPGGTYFVGDAAGLVEPALGAGLHLALQSAVALADDLAGGARYEDAMAPTASRLRENAGSVATPYMLLGLAALKSRA